VRRRLIVDVSVVSAARYVSEAALMVRGLLIAFILGPALFGVWASMRLVLQLSRNAHLGARDGMVQRAALADGHGDVAGAARLRATAAGIDLLAASLVVGLVAAVVLLSGMSQRSTAWWLEFAVVMLVAQFHDFYQVLLRSQRRFGTTACMMIAWAVLSTIAGVWAALVHGLGGFLVALGGSYAVVLAGAVVARPSLPRPALGAGAARELIGAGFPIMSAKAMVMLLWNIDKLLIWAMAGSEPLGVYAVQAVFTNLLLFLPTIVAQVLHPHLMERLGRSGGAAGTRRPLEEGTLLLVLLLCPVIGLLHEVMHLPIRWWLPAYRAAIEPGRILVLSTFFSIAAGVPTTVLVSLGRAVTVIAVRAVALAVAFAAIAAVLAAGSGFTAVAIALSAALALYAVLAVGAALRAVPAGDRPAAWLVRWIVAPGAVMLAAVAVAASIVPDATESWRDDVLATAVRCAIVGAVTAPWTVWAVRRLGLLEGVWRR
jgi:O-antigen/teichoic acid export membrane protein